MLPGNAALAQLRAEQPSRSIRMDVCDLASPASIRACAQRLLDAGRPIDGLINNAGVLRPLEHRETTPEGIEVALATNALGPLLLTTAIERVLGGRAGGTRSGRDIEAAPAWLSRPSGQLRLR